MQHTPFYNAPRIQKNKSPTEDKTMGHTAKADNTYFEFSQETRNNIRSYIADTKYEKCTGFTSVHFLLTICYRYVSQSTKKQVFNRITNLFLTHQTTESASSIFFLNSSGVTPSLDAAFSIEISPLLTISR